MILSALFNFVLQYFIFDLNYNKIEKVQYEDDEYYYYVKAVPKNEYVKSSSVKKKAASKSAAPQKRMSAPANQTKSQAPVRSQAAPVRSAQPSRQAQATGAYERNMNREADLPSQSQVERTARAVMAQRQPDRVINKGPINQGRPSGK